MKKDPIENAASVDKKKRPKRKRKILRKMILSLLLVLVLFVVGSTAYFRLKQEYTVTYDEYAATIGTISNSLSFSGTLQAVHSDSYTASSSTTVRTVYVTVGQDIQEGDALIRLANGQTIAAEYDGRVNQLSVQEGDKVSAGDTLIQVVDFEHMKVSIRVDEYDISDVRAGDACRVTTTATENTFDSVIDNINYVSSSSGSVAYYTATAYVDVSGGVYPGMQVTVTIPQEEASDVVVLKEDALSFDVTNQAFVYMMNDEGTLDMVYVKTGVSNGNYVEIKEGLRSGDVVYVETATTVSGLNPLAAIFGEQRFNQNRNNFGPGTRNQNYNFNNMDGGGFTRPTNGGGGR